MIAGKFMGFLDACSLHNHLVMYAAHWNGMNGGDVKVYDLLCQHNSMESQSTPIDGGLLP